MRVRKTLGIAVAFVAAAAMAACGHALTGEGGSKGPKSYPGNPHDTDIVIWLGAPANPGGQCQLLKSDASVGFHSHNVTWHLRGDCPSNNGQPLTLTFTSTSPSRGCPPSQGCSVTISNGSADLTIKIDDTATSGWYGYQLAVGGTKIDPDLEIDP